MERKGRLKYALDTYFNSILSRGGSNFRDVSINLPKYVEKAMFEVFKDLDSKKLGRITQGDFENLCMDFGIVKNPVTDIKLFQRDYLWTSGQRPYWELRKREQIKSLNFDEFKISIVGCWASMYDFSQQRHSITYDNSSEIGNNHSCSLSSLFTDSNASYRSSKTMPTIKNTIKKVKVGKKFKLAQNTDNEFNKYKQTVSKQKLSKYEPESKVGAKDQKIENVDVIKRSEEEIGNKKNLKVLNFLSSTDENITTLR